MRGGGNNARNGVVVLRNSDRKDVHNSEVPVVCRACEARHRGICGALNPEQLVHLSKHTSKHVYSSQQEVMAEGAIDLGPLPVLEDF